MNKRKTYQLGVKAYHEGKYSEAVEHLSSLTGHHSEPTSLLSRFYLGQAHYRLAVRFFQERRFHEATIHFQAASTALPAGGGFARYLAACYLGVRCFEEAARELEKLLGKSPDDIGLRIRCALAQWKQGSPLDATSTIREGICRSPRNAELHYQLGVMLAADDDWIEAEQLFEKTLATDPSHAGACERLAQICALSSRAEQALRYMERAHQLDPSHPRIAMQLALLTQSSGASAGSVKWHLLAKSPKLEEQALDRLGDAVVREPEFVATFLSLPPSEVDGEVFSTLAATLEHALAKHPEFADLHYHCGAVYNRLGQHREAIEHAERAVEINPRYVNALILLAELYGQTDRKADGVDRLKQAIDAGGDFADVHYLMGKLYQDAGQVDRARRSYQRALDLNHNYRLARDALAALPI